MASKFLLLSLLSFLLLSPAVAHNITRILGQFPDFSTFNSLLNRTKVAAEINRRQTITVLAVDNAAASGLSGLDDGTLRQTLSVHVILDYYGAEKIHSLRRRSTLFTTLFQATGVAEHQMGFLNFTRLSDGRLAFGSAVPGAPLVATYVKALAAKPYNISVLQISSAIVPPGINGIPLAPFGAPIVVSPEPLVPAPAPVDEEVADAPGPEAAEAPASEAEAPASEADAPAADAPAPVGDAPTPAEDSSAEESAVKEESEKSSAGQVVGGIAAGLLTIAGVLLLDN